MSDERFFSMEPREPRQPSPEKATPQSAPSLWLRLLRWLHLMLGVVAGVVIFGGCGGFAVYATWRYYSEQFSTFWGGVFAIISIVMGICGVTWSILRESNRPPKD